MKTKYGFPVVTADNIFNVMEELGIRKWQEVKKPMNLADYLAGTLSLEQREEAERFGPRAEVVFLNSPKGELFRGFRSVAKNWVTVFTVLEEDLIPITAEYKHGADMIAVVPPSGVPSRKDFGEKDPMANCARREFFEETGIELAKVVPLSGPEGNAVSPRQTSQRYFPFLGIPKTPIIPKKQNTDEGEFLKILLIPLPEWIRLIERNRVEDECAITVTFRALQELGHLEVTY